jgi:hypothetical protein
VESRLTVDRIPAGCLEWLVSSRLRFLHDLLDGKPMRYFSAHLPVMATWRHGKNGGEEFPVNMTVKGIGLIPGKRLLADYTDIFEGVIAEARTMPWRESLHARVEAVTRLYGRIDNFDPAVLGGLEIFEGKALENMKENPHSSLLYVGMTYDADGMNYISFQVNGKVEILERDSLYYRFLLASRKLFEFDTFHLFQPDYPFGYLIRVMEVRDKSPWSRASGKPV